MKSQEYQEEQRRFEAELNEWIAKQGLLTQLRLGWTKSGALGVIARLFLVGFILMIVAALGGLAWVNNYLNGGDFRGKLRAGINELYQPETLVFTGGKYESGQYVVDRMRVLEADNAFFHSLEIRDMNLPMDFGQGVWRNWQMGAVEINELDIDLRTHIPEGASASNWFDGVFERSSKFGFNSVMVNSMTLTWEGEQEEGLVELSNVRLRRQDDGWSLIADEGMIDYLWMKGLPLRDIEYKLSRGQLQVVRTTVLAEEGLVKLEGKILGGKDPALDLGLVMESLEIDDLLPPPIKSALTGNISGEGKIVGNFHAGAETQLSLSLDPSAGDNLSVWGAVPYLDALTFLDPSGRYARLPLTNGKAEVLLQKNRCTLKSVDLESREGIRLTGSFVSRSPNEEEIDRLLEQLESADSAEFGGLVIDQRGRDSGLLPEPEDDTDMSEAEERYAKQLEELKKKALEEGDVDAEELRKEGRRLAKILELKKRRVIEGEVEFGLPGVVIERQPIATRLFEKRGRHYWMTVKMKGEVSSIGREEGEKVRELARDRIDLLRDSD